MSLGERGGARRVQKVAAAGDARLEGNESVRRKSKKSPNKTHVTTINVLIGYCNKLYDYCKHSYWLLPYRDITTSIKNATFGQNCSHSSSSSRHRAGRCCQEKIYE